MHIKRVIGASFTLLGMVGFIFALILFISTLLGDVRDEKIFVTSGLFGIIFFVSGIALVRATMDKV